MKFKIKQINESCTLHSGNCTLTFYDCYFYFVEVNNNTYFFRYIQTSTELITDCFLWN